MLHRSINCTMYALSPARRPGTYLLPCLPCCCGIFLRRWASCAPQLAIIQCTSSNESGMASFGGKHPMQRACPPPLPRQLVFFRILHRQGVQFCEGNCITHIQWFSARPSAAQLLRSSRLPFGGLDESLKATGNGFWRPNRRRFPWQRFRHPDRAPKRKQNVHQRNTQEVPGPQDRCLRLWPLAYGERPITRPCCSECRSASQSRHDAVNTMQLAACRPGLPRKRRA